YYSQKRLDALNALATEYREPMFDAKMGTILRGDVTAEYRFHVALGTMYSYLGQYGDEQTPTSAIFQLSRAKQVAEAADRQGGKRITIDPKVIDLLATSYEKVSAPDAAVRVRLDSAEAFKKQGRVAAAQRVFKPLAVNPSGVKTEDRTRYEVLRRDLPPIKGVVAIQPYTPEPVPAPVPVPVPV